MGSSGRRGRWLAAAAWLAAAEAGAETASTALDWARLPLSVRQAAGGGAYSGSDIFRVFDNPALLGDQRSQYELGFSNQFLFAGGENLWAVGGGWVEPPSHGGTVGGAILASGLSGQPVDELDLFGNRTGTSASASGLKVAAAGMYQTDTVSFGALLGRISESYAGIPNIEAAAAPQTTMIDAGLVSRLGLWTVGGAYHNRNGGVASSFSLGGGVHIAAPIRASAGAEVNVPVDRTERTYAEGGVAWNATGPLVVRVGAFVPEGAAGADAASARLGFGLLWQGVTFDYAFAVPLSGASLGSSHLLAMGYLFGSSREGGPPPAFPPTVDTRTLAVGDFDPQDVSTAAASDMAGLLRDQLVRGGAFTVTDKDTMDRLVGAQGFQPGPCSTELCAVRLGRIVGVAEVVVGTFAQVQSQYVVSIRVVDVETGRIAYTDQVVGKDLADVRQGVGFLASHLTAAARQAR